MKQNQIHSEKIYISIFRNVIRQLELIGGL